MATQYTRTYTFTGQRNTRGRRNVAWTKFTVSGDTTHTIGQIVAITYEHYHTSTEKPTWTLKGRLVLSDGTYIDSNTQSHKFSSDVYKYTNTFSALPTAEQFAMITAVQTIANDTADSTSTGGGDLYWRATYYEPMKVIITFVEEPPTHYGPAVDAFSLTRVDANGAASNEGVYLRMDVKLSLLDASNKAGSTVRIYYGTESSIDTATASWFTPKLTIDQMLAGVYGNTQAVPLTFSNGSKWYFALVFACGDEVAVGDASVGRAFAALHISPCSTGGVSIGGFSTSTEGNPKFEVHHPLYAYGGIANMQTGEIPALGNTAGGAYQDGSVTFPRPFAEGTTPLVLICFQSASTAGTFGRCSVAVVSATNTGFTFRFFNGDSSNRNPGYNYIAFGTLA